MINDKFYEILYMDIGHVHDSFKVKKKLSIFSCVANYSCNCY